MLVYSVSVELCLLSFVRMTDSCCCFIVFFFQAEDGIRDLVRSRGLGDVYKRQYECRFDISDSRCRNNRSGIESAFNASRT